MVKVAQHTEEIFEPQTVKLRNVNYVAISNFTQDWIKFRYNGVVRSLKPANNGTPRFFVIRNFGNIFDVELEFLGGNLNILLEYFVLEEEIL